MNSENLFFNALVDYFEHVLLVYSWLQAMVLVFVPYIVVEPNVCYDRITSSKIFDSLFS